MRWPYIILGLALPGYVISSCAPPGPSTTEILDSFENTVNERDLEGTLALFAEDAVLEQSFKDFVIEGKEYIEWFWRVYYYSPHTSEFRDISVDGDTATFTWAEIHDPPTYLWPVIIEVENGKITYLDFEDVTTVPRPDK